MGVLIQATILKAAGGDPSSYDIDGKDILPIAIDGQESPHDYIFWEMGDQTTVRYKNFKLVLNGQLVEGELAQDKIFLSDLSVDMGEKHNLAEEMPELTEQLKKKALAWKEKLEDNWKEKWQGNYNNLS